MYKEREIYQDIESHVFRKEFTIITGARQTGKTTILKQLFIKLKEKEQDVWFINFENQDILTKINESPENLFQFTSRPKNTLLETEQDEPIYILIDEIQYAKNPTNFLKYLYDTYSPNLKIVATGSSAFYIDEKFKDSLIGRKRIFNLRTLNFDEFLTFKNSAALIKELNIIRDRHEYLSIRHKELMQLFEEYITYGGYPAVVLSENNKEKILMLKEIKNSYIKKDILDSKVENTETFYKLMYILSSQTGSLLNKNKISKILNSHIKTIEKYIYVLQKSFHIDLLKPFYKNLSKEITKMPKTYFNDMGLRNILINNFSEIKLRTDKGELFENYVYIRLTELYEQENIRFWRTTDQNEVDFIILEPNSKIKAYEVKYNPKTIKYSKYNKFNQKYKNARLEFVSYLQTNNDKTTHIFKL